MTRGDAISVAVVGVTGLATLILAAGVGLFLIGRGCAALDDAITRRKLRYHQERERLVRQQSIVVERVERQLEFDEFDELDRMWAETNGILL